MVKFQHINNNNPSLNANKPANSDFKQQRLPAWQPILTANSVLPSFFVIGCLFVPIGIGLLITSNRVNEHIIEYTHCRALNGERCSDMLKTLTAQFGACHCKVSFTLKEHFKSDVYIYYGLTNFYQNHRRYVKSRDDKQLQGHPKGGGPLEFVDCEPFAYVNGSVPIAPCGAIANSLFNDTIELYYRKSPESSIRVNLLQKGIAWRTDVKIKFKNPKGYSLKQAFFGTAKPVNWPRPVYELDVQNAALNGFQNQDLMVWMRTSAFPTFRKLYRRVDHHHHSMSSGVPPSQSSYGQLFADGLPAGNYTAIIKYAYPVTVFKGTKSIIISNTSWLGGKNVFLGIAYIVTGSLCLFFGAIFIAIHRKYGNKVNLNGEFELFKGECEL